MPINKQQLSPQHSPTPGKNSRATPRINEVTYSIWNAGQDAETANAIECAERVDGQVTLDPS